MFDPVYRLQQPVLASSIDDAGHARFENDTPLPAGTELRIVEDRHPWPPRPGNELFYTIEVRGARYHVPAAALDRALRTAA